MTDAKENSSAAGAAPFEKGLTPRLKRALDAGRAAYAAGRSLIDCPHAGAVGSLWRFGWNDAAAVAAGVA